MLGHGSDYPSVCPHLYELHGIIWHVVRLSQPVHHGVHGAVFMQLVGHHLGIKLIAIWRWDINCGIGAMCHRAGINMIDRPQISIKAHCTPFLQKLAVVINRSFE